MCTPILILFLDTFVVYSYCLINAHSTVSFCICCCEKSEFVICIILCLLENRKGFFFLSAVIEGCFRGCLSSGCQTVWIQIRPRVVWGLIWVQIVYKDYQQTSLVCKGFKCLLEVCLFEPYYSSTIFLQISYSI